MQPPKPESEMPDDYGVADFQDPDGAAQGALVNLVLAQQFGVIEEIPQEPIVYRNERDHL